MTWKNNREEKESKAGLINLESKQRKKQTQRTERERGKNIIVRGKWRERKRNGKKNGYKTQESKRKTRDGDGRWK